MSSPIVINRWDGGEAEDVRTTGTTQCDTSRNFDVFLEPHRLNPLPDSTPDLYLSNSMDDVRITDVIMGYADGANHVVGVGYKQSGSANLGFFIKATSDINSNWSLQASRGSNSFIRGTGVTYKTQTYAVESNGSTTYTLVRFTAAGNAETIGTFSVVSGASCKTFVHPEDNVLYIVGGNTIAKWDGSSLTSVTTILPSNFDVASVTNYGTYLVVAMNPIYEQNARAYLWGRDMTLNTLQGTIDLGQATVSLCENLDNNLFFVLTPNTSNGFDFENKIIVKRYTGGDVEPIVELFSNIDSSTGRVLTYKAKRNNKLYFLTTSGYCVYKFGKNKQGIYTLTEDRFIVNGALSSTSLGLSIVSNVMWVGTFDNSGVYTLQRTKVSTDSGGISYSNTSTYRTTVNPNMPVQDRQDNKQLVAVQLAFTGKTSGTIGLKYSIDGGSYTSIISQSTTATEDAVEATTEATGTVFGSGNEITFQIECTGGVQPKELKYKYQKLNAQI